MEIIVSHRNLDFDGKAIILRSASGNPEACVINAEGFSGDHQRVIDMDPGDLAVRTNVGRDRGRRLSELARRNIDRMDNPLAHFGTGSSTQ